MKKLISVILSSVLVFMIPALAIAQLDELKNTTPEQRATMLTEKMQSELNLDEKTTAAVAELNLKYARENQTLLDSSGSKLKRFMTFRENAQAKQDELKGILTPQQYSLYRQKKSEMEEDMKQALKEKYEAAH